MRAQRRVVADWVDAVVIGAGEAGTMIASLALEAGHRVALVYRPPYGSTCLNTGCVPSKFLIHRGSEDSGFPKKLARATLEESEESDDLEIRVGGTTIR